jgi:hypothetical protein
MGNRHKNFEDLGVCEVRAGVDWTELSEVLKENIEPFEELCVDGLGDVLDRLIL